jgi:hypothetical protein
MIVMGPKRSDEHMVAPRVVGVTEAMDLVSPSDPEVAWLIEQANASGEMEGLAERLEALAIRRLPPGARLATTEEIEGPPRELRRLFQIATKPLLARGWRRTGNRVVFDSPSGHWADIKIDMGTGPAPVLFFLFAVVGSPYLLRVNGGDGVRPRGFTSAHLSLLLQVVMEYDPAAAGEPRRLTIPQRPHAMTGIVLGRDSGQAWLTDLLERLATTMEGLCSDRAMRDWLVEHGGSAVAPLRDAVLLSRHLGDLDRQPDLLERAQLAAQDPLIRHNNRGRDPMFWSHDRFMRFVNELTD